MEDNRKTKRFKIFILILLVFTVLIIKEENQNKILKFISSLGKKEKILMETHFFKSYEGIESVNLYDGTIVRYVNNKISLMKVDGSPIIEKEFNFTESAISYGEKKIYVYDKFAGDIYILDKNGETVQRLELGKIFNLKESNGNIIYHIKDEDKEGIKILDKNNLLFGSHFYTDNKITSYSINKAGDKTAIALLNLSGQVLKSQIDIYNDENEDFISIEFQEEIILYLELISKNELIVLSDTSLYLIKDGEIGWKKEYNLIKDIYLGKNEVHILHGNYLETIDLEGNSLSKISFTEDYNKIIPFDGGFIAYGDNGLIILNGSKEILRYDIDIIKVFTSKNNIIIWNNEGIGVYILTNKK